jgi:hypothetical protein
MAANLIKWLQRFILKQRIEMLRADIALAVERRDHAQMTVESIDKWYSDAQRRLRQLRANLALLERPDTLLAEALRHGE